MPASRSTWAVASASRRISSSKRVSRRSASTCSWKCSPCRGRGMRSRRTLAGPGTTALPRPPRRAPSEAPTFELAASISAVQWLSTPEEVQALSAELARTCTAGTCVAIQHYPHSSEEMVALGSAIKREGFSGGILVDNPKNPRKRKVLPTWRGRTAERVVRPRLCRGHVPHALSLLAGSGRVGQTWVCMEG